MQLNPEIIAILVVIGLVAIARIWQLIIGPGGPLTARRHKEITELEVKIRMGQGEQLVEDLRHIAPLYAKVGKPWEAEEALRRALTISKQHWGERSPSVIAILEDLANLMHMTNRRVEAKNYKKEIKKLKT